MWNAYSEAWKKSRPEKISPLTHMPYMLERSWENKMPTHLFQNHPNADCQRIGLFLKKLVSCVGSLQPVFGWRERPVPLYVSSCALSSSQGMRLALDTRMHKSISVGKTHIRDGRTFCPLILASLFCRFRGPQGKRLRKVNMQITWQLYTSASRFFTSMYMFGRAT